jgi:hypothetical protein
MIRNLLRLAFCIALAATPAFAVNASVGTCLPQFTTFSTITQAINAVPAGSTIFVCPGTYPEQLFINKKLSLRGAFNGSTGAAVITAPAGGLVQNTSSLATGNPIAAQIVFDGVSSASVSYLVVDGSNNNIQTCGLNPIGIYYRNSSGSIMKNSVLNQILPSGFTGCQSGLGIFVQSGPSNTSTVSISGNYVHNYQKNGITGNEVGTAVTITGNTVIGSGPTSGAAENSIQIGFGATGTITGNTVGDDIWAPDTSTDPGDAAAGILVFGSFNITISSNVVNSTQFGISVNTDSADNLSGNGNIIKLNKVSTSEIFDGIDLCSNANTVTGNTVTGSDESAVHFDDTCTGLSTGNSVSGNTLNTACTAFLFGPGASGNPIGTNTIINTLSVAVNGFNTCTPPGLATAHRVRVRPHGFRP